MMNSTSNRNSIKSNGFCSYSAATHVKHHAWAVCLRLFSVLFWMLLWHLLSCVLGQNLLLVSPAVAIQTLFRMLGEISFYQAIFGSLSRILSGFLLGVLTGTILAALAYAFRPAEILFMPLMQAIKATPVASFVILALIFVSSKYLSVLMSFLMALPILYANVLTGLHGVDRRLIEMAHLFHMKRSSRIQSIFLPAAYPNFLSACALALGLSWKAGIAAEVIGLPDRSIGEALYQAKIFFSTPELFAWTLAIILLSVCLEQGVRFFVGLVNERLKNDVTPDSAPD